MDDETHWRSPLMTTTPTRMAGRREWVGLAVLAFACLLYVMDLERP